MTLSISFKWGSDLNRFYNEMLSNPSSLLKGVTVEEGDLKAFIDLEENNDKDNLDGKVFVNNIKQYMRDNDMSYTMEA